MGRETYVGMGLRDQLRTHEQPVARTSFPTHKLKRKSCTKSHPSAVMANTLCDGAYSEGTNPAVSLTHVVEAAAANH